MNQTQNNTITTNISLNNLEVATCDNAQIKMVASLITLVVITLLSLLWAKALIYMHENHSEYKGKDLFDELP